MRDKIGNIITALAGLGFCGLGVKIAWWLIAMLLRGVQEQSIWKLMGAALLTYFGGLAVVVIFLGIGIGLLAVSIDN